MSFFSELKRRKVFRVAIAYAAVGWLLVEVSSVVLPTFEAPDWVQKVVTFLVVLGFPLAVALAWAFELTPKGLRREVPAEKASDTAANPTPQSSGAQRRKSIAVLPFVDMSQDRDNEHFTDGLTDELLNVLTGIADLRVAQRAYYLGAAAWYCLNEMEKAYAWAERAYELAPDDAATRYNLACFYSEAGDKDKAFACLENSISSRSWIENDPNLDPLRDDPRFAAYLETLN